MEGASDSLHWSCSPHSSQDKCMQGPVTSKVTEAKAWWPGRAGQGTPFPGPQDKCSHLPLKGRGTRNT